MKRRNNIVTMLMDKVPRKNREGYAPSSSMDGHLMLVELESSGDIADFLANHEVFSEISGQDRRRMYDTLCENALLHSMPGCRTTLLLKVRLSVTDDGRIFTPLAHLATKFGRMYVIALNGARNAKYDRDASSSTIDSATFLELAQDMPIITCVLPDGTSADQFTYQTNGAHVE